MSISARVTLDEYDRMIARGDFEPREEHHVELLRGEICEMSPIGPAHEDVLDVLNRWSTRVTSAKRVRIRVQNSIGIPSLESVPQPDLAWVRAKRYSRSRPRTEDVLLLVEVADSSLAKDRGEKLDLYAAAGIRDYWIVNIPDRCVEVHRRLQGDAYRSVLVFGSGQQVSPLGFPRAVLKISLLFE